MRKILWMVGLFLNSFAFSQVSEGFNDGEFLHQPAWGGDTGRFEVNVAKQLKSKPFIRGDTANLSTSNKMLLNSTWEFYVQINVDPSTSNQLRVYLSSDNAALDSPGNGYFLQIGETGSSDSYDIYRKSGKTITKIIDGPAKVRTTVDTIRAWFMVIHRIDGYWELYSRPNTSVPWNGEGNCMDRTFRKSNFAGISIKHTTTRADKFLFDNFYVYPYDVDTSGPEYNDVEIHDDTVISLLFSEEIDTIGLKNTVLFSVNNTIHPQKVSVNGINSNLLDLVFSSPIPAGRTSIRFPRLYDLLGNRSDSAQTVFVNYTPVVYSKSGDVIISEIMADPTPVIGLPEVEYIELYNTTDYPIQLANWEYQNGSSKNKLPNKLLQAHSFVILCKSSDTSLLKPYGNYIGFSTWPSIVNTSGSLKILNDKNQIIDQVNYKQSWYKNKSKENGGYSLEHSHPTKICDGFYAWEASSSSVGGTPGSANTVWSIDDGFYVQQVEYLTDSTLYIRFNKASDTLYSKASSNYWLKNANAYPTKIQFLNERYDEVLLIFGFKFKNKKTYTLQLNNFRTCDNIYLEETTFQNVFVNQDDTSKIKINELYLDPYPSYGLSENEYLELFNASPNTVDLSGYSIYINSTRFILPKVLLKKEEYLIVCATADTAIMKTYGKCIGLNALSTLSNTSASISINNKVGRLIDRVNYKQQWYRDQTKFDGGWSLELIDPYNRCDFINKWAASNNSIGGTPGKRNSIANFRIDQKNLSVANFTKISANQFQVKLNKAIDGRFINPAQFYFVGPKLKLYFPTSVQLDSPYYETVLLTFANAIPNGKYNFICQDMPSCSRADTSIVYPILISSTIDIWNNIKLSEIMADPSPTVGLPNCEYIELHNNSDQQLQDLKLFIADTKDTILVTIDNWKPNEYLILCANEFRNVWDSNVHVIVLNNMLSIANEEDTIRLLNAEKNKIDELNYSYSMMPIDKKDGGYSYEKLSGTWDCNDPMTWQASMNTSGGSPGIKNATIEEYELEAPKITSYEWLNDNTIIIASKVGFDSLSTILISDKIGNTYSFKINAERKIELVFEQQINEGEKVEINIYQLNCLGIVLDTNLIVYKKHVPRDKEIIISEMLFNPYPGSVDFIELYNNSDYIIDAKTLSLSDGKNTIEIDKYLSQSNSTTFIPPHTYCVFTSNKSDILTHYTVPNPEQIIELKSLPSMPDNHGNIYVTNEFKEVLDQVEYDEKFHLSWIKDAEGRSLERKRIDPEQNNQSNWSSATDEIGYASPTGKNSQHQNASDIEVKKFWLSKDVLNPVRNATDQQLEINYTLVSDAQFVNVKLYTKSGVFLKEIIHGSSIRNTGVITWDLGLNGQLLVVGTYILSVESYSENGQYQYYKIPFVIHY